MPRFKSTKNIFSDLEEFFNDNWMDSSTLILPEKENWDYSRTMNIEDVDVWEVIYEQSGGIGVYASWSPYAEFYMIRVGWDLENNGYGAETYYGKGALKTTIKRCNELNIPININKVWVGNDQMWLYTD